MPTQYHSPGRADHISPSSMPKNARTDPFYSPTHTPEHGSPYEPHLFSPDEMFMNERAHDIKFETVDWAAKNRDSKREKKDRKRSLTPTKEKELDNVHVETISLTPSMVQAKDMQMQQPKPAYYSPPRLNLQSPPQYQGAAGGLNIYNPDEKRGMDRASWEPTHPPPSHYVPCKEFEDVELNKPRGQHASPQRTVTQKHYEPPQYYQDSRGRSWPGWAWIVFILFFLICFIGIPLAIFGGVYHWNYGEYRCSRSWGTWDLNTNSCRY
ncbi:hypothetical protein BJ878DRAFT_479344 [Calycina marina]|uniref:Uncharacterized protein n=1 Tax=Calycina marina TaxID=1763456 RepID=A0A9P7Z530_9HELO|nr:hypothetical protein BJ878DRAFT_479344 [Calycina marina]